MDEEKSLELLRAIAAAGDKANMWTAGESVGLDRGTTEALSLELMDRGYLDMASLSGAVRLTPPGRRGAAGRGRGRTSAGYGGAVRSHRRTGSGPGAHRFKRPEGRPGHPAGRPGA